MELINAFLKTRVLAFVVLDISRVVRKRAFCICENKGADQLRGNREANQRLCFRYSDSTIPLLPTSSSHLLLLYIPVCVGPGRKPRRPVLSQRGSYLYVNNKGTNQPAHLHSLISAFVIHC